MNEQQTQAKAPRESYSAPNYERFTFETSGLMQTSEETVSGFLGSSIDKTTAEQEDWD